MDNTKLVTCKCGWVHFSVTRDFAEQQVKEFNDFYNLTTDEVKSCYGGPAKVVDYEQCMTCGGSYKDFIDYDFKQHGNMTGHTINPIIRKED